MAHHGFQNGGLFDHASIGCQVAVENRQPPLTVVWVVQGPDHLGIEDIDICDIFGNGFACDREAIVMEQALRRPGF